MRFEAMLFITMVLGPACIFLLYVLFQFWREATRPARQYQRRSTRVVTLVTAPASRPEDTLVDPPARAAEESASSSRRSVAMFPRAAKRSAPRKVR
jgi:hypothetical protein